MKGTGVNMITAMIVDDEPIIRKGIKTEIDWESIGIQVIDEAANGRDGLAKALIKKPDIVITDIKMPIMDGIKLSAALKEKLPKTKVVFLSGYSDVDYLRQAIKLNAVDYLLKPVSLQELVNLMVKLKSRIEQETVDYKNQLLSNQLLIRNLPWIRNKCINQFIGGSITEEEFRYQAEKVMHINLTGPTYQMVAFNIDNYYQMVSRGEKETDLLKYAVSNIASEILEKAARVTICDGGDSTLLALLSTEAAVGEVVECCKEIQFYIRKYYNISVTIGIGEKVEQLSELKISCLQAKKAVESKISEGNNRIIVMNGDANNKNTGAKLFLSAKEEKELIEKTELLSKIQMQQVLDDLFRKYFYGQPVDRKTAEQLCMNLILIAVRELQQGQLAPEKVLQQDYYYYDEISKYETLTDLELWIKSIFNKVLYALETQRSSKYKNIVTAGIEYVKNHYKENIMVTDVANYVFVTPNYFSKVFKEETGENFTEWLGKYRIECAKQLMTRQPNMKNYQVAEEVGFSDYKYFTYIFKKHTGYTPNTYKQLMG